MSLLQVADLSMKDGVRCLKMQRRLGTQHLYQKKPVEAVHSISIRMPVGDFIQRCSGHAHWEWRLQGRPRSPWRHLTVYTVWPPQGAAGKSSWNEQVGGRKIYILAGITVGLQIGTEKWKDGWMNGQMDAYTILNKAVAFWKNEKTKNRNTTKHTKELESPWLRCQKDLLNNRIVSLLLFLLLLLLFLWLELASTHFMNKLEMLMTAINNGVSNKNSCCCVHLRSCGNRTCPTWPCDKWLIDTWVGVKHCRSRWSFSGVAEQHPDIVECWLRQEASSSRHKETNQSHNPQLHRVGVAPGSYAPFPASRGCCYGSVFITINLPTNCRGSRPWQPLNVKIDKKSVRDGAKRTDGVPGRRKKAEGLSRTVSQFCIVLTPFFFFLSTRLPCVFFSPPLTTLPPPSLTSCRPLQLRPITLPLSRLQSRLSVCH